MNRRFLFPALPVAVLALAGCNLPIEPAKPDAVRYFLLSGTPGVSAPAGLEVRPVQLPAYLQSRLMVVRLSDHEIRYAEEAHWAEALEAGLTARLRGRLQPPGAAGAAAGYAVRVRLQQCEGLAAGGADSVRLAATFEIIAAGDETVVARQEFTAKPRDWDGRDFGQLARRLGEAADELAESIAAARPKK